MNRLRLGRVAASPDGSVRPPPEPSRNHALDSLRGLAIGLMILDHLTGILLGFTLQDSSVRSITRLSMPLFCVLMGYFLQEERRRAWRRPTQVLLACLTVNLLFYPTYGSVEILASLLIAYLVFLTTGRWFPVCVLAIGFYLRDPSPAWFDFPLTIVVPFVAQGAVLRRYGVGAALLTGTLLASGAVWIEVFEPNGVNQKLCLCILPATLLVDVGRRLPTKRIPGLDWMGRHPLSVYVGQYYLIFGWLWLMQQFREAGMDL